MSFCTFNLLIEPELRPALTNAHSCSCELADFMLSCAQTILMIGRVSVTNDTLQIVGSFRNATCLSAAMRILPVQGSDIQSVTFTLLDNENFVNFINISASSYAYLETCSAGDKSVSCGFTASGLDPSANYHLLATYSYNSLQVSVFLFAPYISGEWFLAFPKSK